LGIGGKSRAQKLHSEYGVTSLKESPPITTRYESAT
jgi:hypothetical protein